MLAEHAEDVLLYLFIATTCGAIATYLLSRYLPEFPYTAIIFAVGIIFAVCFERITTHDVMKESLDRWDHIPPDLILFVFLPALLFGEAMSLNFQHVKGAVTNASILAGPGAVFGTFAIAGMAGWILPYKWNWHLCFLFGAILSATDPVAVVALLKKVGAPVNLTYTIVGEALINDGAALVLFNLMYLLIEKDPEEEVDAGYVAIYFVKVIFLSPLIGAGFGLVSLFLLGISNRRLKEEDTTVQMAITLACAYLSFYVAEQLVHVSGVLTCCSAALVLARYANPLILKPETLHSIWAALEWIGNTLVFFLAGLIIAIRTFKYVQVEDLGYIVLVYVLIMVIRAVMIAILFPLLRLCGKGVSLRDCVFMTWGGLRGAVSMTLSLLLVQNTERNLTSISVTDSHRVFFLVGGVATLTLIINAPTAGWLLDKLGLKGGGEESGSKEGGLRWSKVEGSSKKSITHSSFSGKQILYHYVKKRIRLKAYRLLEHLMKKHQEHVDPLFVIKTCSILRMGAGAAPSMEGAKGLLGEISMLSHVHEVNREGSMYSSPPKTETRRRNSHTDSQQQEAAAVAAGRRGGLVRAYSLSYGALGKDFNETGIGTPGDAAGKAEDDEYHHSLVDTLSHIEAMWERGLTMFEGHQAQFRVRGMSSATSPPPVTSDPATSLSSLPHPLPAIPSTDYRTPQTQLLGEIRRAFLTVVRLHYFKQLNSGRLPRTSRVAATLLASVDVGMEGIHTPGLQDWGAIEEEWGEMLERLRDGGGWGAVDSAKMTTSSRGVQLGRGDVGEEEDGGISDGSPRRRDGYDSICPPEGKHGEDIEKPHIPDKQSPPPGPSPSSSSISFSWDLVLERVHEYRLSQLVYLLVAFIEAHEHAQRKIPFYLGELETVDTLEEALVVQESAVLVRQAYLYLSYIHPLVIRSLHSKQACRAVWHLQEDSIEMVMKEGIITEAQGEELLAEVEQDRLGLLSEERDDRGQGGWWHRWLDRAVRIGVAAWGGGWGRWKSRELDEGSQQTTGGEP